MEKTKEKVKNTKRPYSELGYSKPETTKLVSSMNELLACYSVHYQKLRNFHWNVKGADFFDIHQQFEMQYEAAKTAIDEIAERIRVFGMTPLSTMTDYLEISEIKECGTDLSSDDMVAEILDDYRILLERLSGIAEMANKINDNGTENMMKGFIKYIEKNHWMMTSFLSGD